MCKMDRGGFSLDNNFLRKVNLQIQIILKLFVHGVIEYNISVGTYAAYILLPNDHFAYILTMYYHELDGWFNLVK